MWIKCKDRMPEKDGLYIAQTFYNSITIINYTVESGWNTYFDEDGDLHNEHALSYGYIYRWLDAGDPPEITAEEALEWGKNCEH